MTLLLRHLRESHMSKTGEALKAFMRDIRCQIHEVLDIVYTKDPKVASLREYARKSTQLRNVVREGCTKRSKQQDLQSVRRGEP